MSCAHPCRSRAARAIGWALLLCALSAAAPAGITQRSYDNGIAMLASQVSQDQIRARVTWLEGFGTRYFTTTKCAEAGAGIQQYFLQLGLDTSEDTFTIAGYRQTFSNIVATRRGRTDPDKIYIIGAHYDSYARGTASTNAPGADDNASGTAALMEIARILSSYTFDYTITFIAFGAEEAGLYGSEHYARAARQRGDQILGVLNLDMIGYVDRPGEDLNVCTDAQSRWLADAFSATARQYVGLPVAITYSGESDHESFWNSAYSAVLIIDDDPVTNPHYHRTTDTSATLDFAFLTQMAQASLAVLADLAQPVGPAATPTVTGVAPSFGPTTGGTVVTVTGTNFIAGQTTVTIGGTAAMGVSVVNSTTLRATVSSHAAGPTDLVVTNPGSPPATLSAGFTYREATTGSPLNVDPGTLRYAGTNSGGALGPITGGQSVTVSFGGAVATEWTAAADQPWVHISQPSAAGAGRFDVSIVNPANVLGLSTNVISTITVAADGASNSPQSILVELSLGPVASMAGPFGQIDTPVQNATEVSGAIGVTGWALDDVGVTGVRIYRNCLPFDHPASCQMRHGASTAFVGDAAFLTGARPDVEAAFPTYPQADRGGWGYLMLTNMLPHVTNGLAYGGQGTLQLYAIATDVEGKTTLLGRSRVDHTPTSITLTNDTIAKPFGAIDTPAQGETVSGLLANFGWVLTRDGNTSAEAGDVSIPTDGSTVGVFLDGVKVGQVAYNQCRGRVGNPVPAGSYCDDDVANIFGNGMPQATFTQRLANVTPYRNLDEGRAAIGSFAIDTTTLTNGRHTIAWGVTDSAGRTEGIGSRFFNVLNSGADPGVEPVGAGFSRPQLAVRLMPDATVVGAAETRPLRVRVGFDSSAAFEDVPVDAEGVYTIRLAELGRLELRLGPVEAGHLLANGARRELPPGSHLDTTTGVFRWAPGPGFFGTYRLVFQRVGAETLVDVTIGPDASSALDEGAFWATRF